MKKLFAIAASVIVIAGCTTNREQGRPFRLIWRETSATPIEKVQTPDGFMIAPADAVKPIIARSTRLPRAEFYLFIDSANYYFGNTTRGTDLKEPEAGYWVINGMTGGTTRTEPDSDGLKPAR
jgi:hypothetical protein